MTEKEYYSKKSLGWAKFWFWFATSAAVINGWMAGFLFCNSKTDDAMWSLVWAGTCAFCAWSNANLVEKIEGAREKTK